MQRRSIILLAVLALVVPGTAFAWGGKGDYEPSTVVDRNGGWMFNNSDVVATNANPPVRKVYLSGFEGTPQALISTSFSPNLATLRTSHPTTSHQTYALLGVWKDCNKDGYIGYGDHGLWEYRTELLSDNSVCKVTAPPNPIPRDWPPVHATSQWVKEFLPIGYDSRSHAPGIPDANPWNFHDYGVRVWADDGKPGDPPSVICFIRPVPTGTYRTAGSVVDYVDCFSVGRVNAAIGTATGATGTGSQWNTARATQNPWGAPGGASYVEAFDCTRPMLVPTRDVTPTTGVGVANPKVPVVRTTGSPGGTVNETATALHDCNRTDGNGQETENAAANLAYVNEDDQVLNQLGAKHETDETLGFSEGTVPVNPIFAAALGPAASSDAGLGQTSLDGFWTGNRLRLTYNSFYTLGEDHLAKVKHYSYYAFVSDAAVIQYGLTLPKASPKGIYGAEACTLGIGPGKPAQNSWECDPTTWWGGAPSYPNMPREPLLCLPGDAACAAAGGVAVGAVPGSFYNLRDVDCFDESAMHLREAGVRWGIHDGSKCAGS